MILHLERKFISPSETFIANQINSIKRHQNAVFTAKFLDNLEANAAIYPPPFKLNFLQLKILSSKSKLFFQNTWNTLNISLIHSHYLTDASFFSPFTEKYKVPKVCSCYGYDVNEYPNRYGWLIKSYYKRVFKEYDLFFAMSDYMKKELLDIGCPEEKIRVHYHGINTKLFDVVRKEGRNGELKILTIGRLSATKGHITALKAIKHFRRQHPEAKISYTIVGDGNLKNELVEYVRQHDLEKTVLFEAFCTHGDKFNNYLREADVFLLPCRRAEGAVEGIPGSIAEAMASGLPVISTYHGGIPSIITDRKTGFLVKENDEKAISDVLFALYNDENMRSSIGMNAKIFASAYLDLHIKTEALEDIYQSLISNTR